ncbi:MAG: hypothetical protein Q7R85_02575 [bacterium]|nr:hypothetical protein [bacterium]
MIGKGLWVEAVAICLAFVLAPSVKEFLVVLVALSPIVVIMRVPYKRKGDSQ